MQRVSGISRRAFAQARLFAPLGMRDTHFHDDHTMIVPHRTPASQPRDGGGWQISIPVFDTYGATSLFTTISDLLIGMANSGRYRGLAAIGHGGADAVYRAQVERYPERGLAVVVLGNASIAGPNVLLRNVTDVPLDTISQAVIRVRLSGDTLRLGDGRRLVTTSDELDVRYALTLEDSTLVLRHRMLEDQTLAPAFRDAFTTGPGTTVQFTRDRTGAVSGFTFTDGRSRGPRRLAAMPAASQVGASTHAEERPMEQAPKWFLPTAIAALLWNLLGCAAYLGDVMLKPEDIAKLSAAQQAMHAARPMWSVAATAIAVWFGAAGCVGLIMRKRWATPLFIASLAGLVVQNVSLFAMAGALADTTAMALQGLVFVIAVALLLLARKATAQRWIA